MTVRVSARAASQKARIDLARQLLKGTGVIAREDSDDEIEDDDIPWEWIHSTRATTATTDPSSTQPHLTAQNDTENGGQLPLDQTKDREQSHDTSQQSQPQPIGARCGSFQCQIGDILLLKADGQKAAWVGLAAEFGLQNEEKSVLIMWFSAPSEIRSKTKKRKDFFLNELYLSPTFDWNPLESINGKAEVHGEAAFNKLYPAGLTKTVQKKGKIFICRRACDVRPAEYSPEFVWEDMYKGRNTDLQALREWVIQHTQKPDRRRRIGVEKPEVEDQSDEDMYDIKEEELNEEDDDFEKEKPAPRTPKKRRREKAVNGTPKKDKSPTKKFTTPTHKRIASKKALTFTPLSLRTLEPAKHLSTPYQIARSRLHVSSVPASLPCRENEFATVYTHLHDAISNGSGSCIYISGTPGTGKTATVREVIQQLHYQVQEEELEDFIFLEINGMKITDPHQSYSLLWEAIQGDSEDMPARVAPNHALSLLEREFSRPSPRRVPIVVLMDELDQLVTKNQSVMYNFFNWPAMTHSRLIVLAVANTMDLPERTLSNKISSRLGLTRITFPGYTHDQLMKIIQSRLEGVPDNIVDPDAVQFASRKVAAVSGDARRALDICRRAVEIVEQSRADRQESTFPSTPSKSGRNQTVDNMVTSDKVTIQVIIKAINEATNSPLQLYLRHLPLSAKIFLAALLGRMRRSGVNENLMADVIEDAERLVRMAPSAVMVEVLLGKEEKVKKEQDLFLTPRRRGGAAKQGDGEIPRVKGLMIAAAGLVEGGIIGLEMNRRGERAGRVRLNVGEEEIKAALKDDLEVGGMGFNG